jgi:hypothetical protein
MSEIAVGDRHKALSFYVLQIRALPLLYEFRGYDLLI